MRARAVRAGATLAGVLALAACGAGQIPASAPAVPAASPPQVAAASSSASSTAEVCPPPAPAPDRAVSVPATIYAWYGIVSSNHSADVLLYEDIGKPTPITFYFQNESRYTITLPAQPPMVRIGSTDAFPLTAWAGLRVPAGREVTTSVPWPPHPAGSYMVTLHGGTYVVDCVHQGMRIDGGGGVVQVLPPADQVLVGSVQPGTSVTTSGYTVRLEGVTMARTGTTATLWIGGLHVPADQVRVSALHDGQPLPLEAGGGTREVPGGGELTAAFAPTPVGTRQLVIQVDTVEVFVPGALGLHEVSGPWRFQVPVGASGPGQL